MGLKQRVLGRIPGPVKVLLRRLRRRLRRTRWERSVRDDEQARVGHDDLVRAFRELGVQAGQDLILHSALSRIGMVEGGPSTVIDALLEVLGPEATLLMPTYHLPASTIDTMRDPTPFDVNSSPSSMGKITEMFRMRPGVRRSGHPTHSVAALGPRAELYTSRHHLSGSPVGPASPFRLLSENRGNILCIGIGVGKVTSHHVIEELVDDFPLEVYLPQPLSKPVVLGDGQRVDVETRVHDPQLQPLRIDNHKAVRDEILAEMRARGIVSEGMVGKAASHLFGAAELDELHRARLAAGKHTIYAA